MGKIEKVVVLSVLFLMVVIFVVLPPGAKKTVNAGDKTAKVENTEGRLRSNDLGDLGVLDSNRLRRNDSGRKNSHTPFRPKANAAPVTGAVPTETEGLLSAPVRPGSKSRPDRNVRNAGNLGRRADQVNPDQGHGGLVKPDLKATQKPGLNPSWSLVRMDGLTDTLNPAYKTYTSRNGDTFKTVAKRFYGDKRHESFLRRNNEGVGRLKAGQVVLMPCVNETPLGATYTVREGDSLWRISKSQYKAGHRWKEIYDANRHVMKSPDDLSLGMELTIP